MLGLGLGVFAILLLIEVPKTLSQLQGSSPQQSPAPATAAVAPAGSGAAAVAARKAARVVLRFGSKDPFVPQVEVAASSAATPASAIPPAVRTTLVPKDPFVTQVSDGSAASAAASAAAAIPATAPTPALPETNTQSRAAGSPGVADRHIVVLDSLQSHAEAVSSAKGARSSGLSHVGILNSSSYGTLRPGFWVVYIGESSSVDQTLRSLASARNHGFASAYTRPLGSRRPR